MKVVLNKNGTIIAYKYENVEKNFHFQTINYKEDNAIEIDADPRLIIPGKAKVVDGKVVYFPTLNNKEGN